jgi:hypothetical protein
VNRREAGIWKPSGLLAWGVSSLCVNLRLRESWSKKSGINRDSGLDMLSVGYSEGHVLESVGHTGLGLSREAHPEVKIYRRN